MAEKSSTNTSDITVLALAKMTHSDKFSPPLREKRALSLASRQLTAGPLARPTTLSLSREPSSPEYDVPSPGLVSPTTPQVIEEDPKGEQRNRSQSCTTPVGVSRHASADNDEIAKNLMKSALKNRENPENDRKADNVANELLKYADQFDHGEMQTIESCFRLTDPEVVSHFKKTIQNVQNKLSWTKVARLLHLGVRLLRNITPESHSVHSQQWNLLMVFLEFLQEELSTWVDQHGGWDAFLLKWTEGEPLHSASMPNLHSYHHQHPLHPCRLETLQSHDESEPELPELPAAEEGDHQVTEIETATSDNHEDGATASSCPNPIPVSLSRPIPCPASRPRSLVLGPHSCPTRRRASSLHSNDTPTTSSSAALGLSFGLGAIFGCALYSFISGK